MVETVAKLGLKRKLGYLYFLSGPDVWCVPLDLDRKPVGSSVRVASVHFPRIEGFMYFLSDAGDVARVARDRRQKQVEERHEPCTAEEAVRDSAWIYEYHGKFRVYIRSNGGKVTDTKTFFSREEAEAAIRRIRQTERPDLPKYQPRRPFQHQPQTLTEKQKLAEKVRLNREARAEKRRAHRANRIPVVYFIQAGDGPIKIGIATDVQARLKGLQTGSPAVLQLLAVIPGDRELEIDLHGRFKAHRLHGEWFSPTTEILSFIQGLKK